MSWIQKILPNRAIKSGDPNPWQLWRWMDIEGPSVETAQHTELYLRRLYAVRTPWFGVMLHWIVREDWDRDALHNHPWRFFRFILRGGYTEQVAYAFDKTTLTSIENHSHRRFSAGLYPKNAYHRISSVKPNTLTLVINGPKRYSWGFFVPGEGHVWWQHYVNGAR